MGVFRDPVVLVRMSQPVDPESLGQLHVRDGAGAVPSCLETSPDLQVLIWRPRRLLSPGAEHVIVLQGLRNRKGQLLPCVTSRFVCGALSHADI